jgi:hypothetical protein
MKLNGRGEKMKKRKEDNTKKIFMLFKQKKCFEDSLAKLEEQRSSIQTRLEVVNRALSDLEPKKSLRNE